MRLFLTLCPIVFNHTSGCALATRGIRPSSMPRSTAQFCQPGAGARRKLADDRKVAGPQSDSDDGAVRPSGAGFGQGFGGPGRRQHRRGLPAGHAPVGFRRRRATSSKMPGMNADRRLGSVPDMRTSPFTNSCVLVRYSPIRNRMITWLNPTSGGTSTDMATVHRSYPVDGTEASGGLVSRPRRTQICSLSPWRLLTSPPPPEMTTPPRPEDGK